MGKGAWLPAGGGREGPVLGFLSTSSGIGLLESAEWEGLLLVWAAGGNIWFVILNTSTLWHT